RFENSVIGPIELPVYGWDISSAYPYQLTQLPCLMHAEWRKTNREDISHGIIRYELRDSGECDAWGPLPFRLADGCIAYPATSGGDYAWATEYRSAKKLVPQGLRFIEALELVSHCSCVPFGEVPRYYLERLRIGKDG